MLKYVVALFVIGGAAADQALAQGSAPTATETLRLPHAHADVTLPGWSLTDDTLVRTADDVQLSVSYERRVTCAPSIATFAGRQALEQKVTIDKIQQPRPPWMAHSIYPTVIYVDGLMIACFERLEEAGGGSVVLVIGGPNATIDRDHDAGLGPVIEAVVTAYSALDEAMVRRANRMSEQDRGASTSDLWLGGGVATYQRLTQDDRNFGAQLEIGTRLRPTSGMGLYASASFLAGFGEGDAVLYGELVVNGGLALASKHVLLAALASGAVQSIGPAGPFEVGLTGLAEVRAGTFFVRGTGTLAKGVLGVGHDELGLGVGIPYDDVAITISVRRLAFDDEPDDPSMHTDRLAYSVMVGFFGNLD